MSSVTALTPPYPPAPPEGKDKEKALASIHLSHEGQELDCLPGIFGYKVKCNVNYRTQDTNKHQL